MSFYQTLYILLLILSFAVSVFSFKYHRSLYILSILFALGIVTETLFNVFYYLYEKDYFIFYHVYIPLEFLLITLFFYQINNNHKIKTLMITVLPFYVLLVIVLYFGFYTVDDYPGWIYNAGGIFIILWSVITLFNIEPSNIHILKLPIFWICSGMILFYAGIFSFNGMYDFLLKTNYQLSDNLLYGINKFLNYLLYIFFIIGFVCSNRMKRYLQP